LVALSQPPALHVRKSCALTTAAARFIHHLEFATTTKAATTYSKIDRFIHRAARYRPELVTNSPPAIAKSQAFRHIRNGISHHTILPAGE
jgi:hypothetical protein